MLNVPDDSGIEVVAVISWLKKISEQTLKFYLAIPIKACWPQVCQSSPSYEGCSSYHEADGVVSKPVPT